MANIDISVTRSLTINTGNYESIKPTVTLTARDIVPTNVADAYLALDDAISGLIKMEIVSCTGEMKKVSDGLDRYCTHVNSRMQEIGENIEQSFSKLSHF